MVLLIRLCSYHEDLQKYGIILIKSLLQQSTLKYVYRGITGSKDQVVSPCLRMLTEMTKFNFGIMCGFVHSSFDFTIKDIPKHLDVKNNSGKATVEDPARPSVRTLMVRFFLSFLQHGEPSVRNEMLGLRTWITPLFKHLKTDTPQLIYELLEVMKTKVLAEDEIPRATKTNAFNEWILGHILSLYGRDEIVKYSKAGKEEEKPLSQVAHEFLLEASTKKGSGVCFPDHGWYPPGHGEGDEKRSGKAAPKVHNRILSSFTTNIRPHADTAQLDLILEIFKTSPELVADHFLSHSNSTFSFDPKLTSTWVGLCTFLLAVISLPIPENFGGSDSVTLPPPSTVVIENIMPKPLSKTVMTKCLTHESGMIRFFSTRILLVAFKKLREVLEALDVASADVHDPSELWKKCRFEVIEEFCKRVPDVSIVITGGGKKAATDGILQTEAKMRLLAEYYSTIPEMAAEGKFDVNVALSTFLGDNNAQHKGMKLLEMGHLLKIANEVPDVKWWNKTPTMKHSPFVAILQLCCSTATNAPQQQIRALLHSFASASYLFQAETKASPLDALLESLSTVKKDDDLEAILSLLDEVVARCIRGPFKYLDDYAEIAAQVQDKKTTTQLAPVSPIVMTLVEQWKFFMQAKDKTAEQKAAGVQWLMRFLESCAFTGENKNVLAVLIDRVAEVSESHKKTLQQLKEYLKDGQSLELATNGMDVDDNKVSVRDIFAPLPERSLNLQIVDQVSAAVASGKVEASIFDLAIAQRAIAEVVKSKKITGTSAVSTVKKLNELVKAIAFGLIGKEGKVSEKTKAFIIAEAPCIELFCDASTPKDRVSLVVELSHGYAALLTTAFERGDSALEAATKKLPAAMVQFVESFDALSEDDRSKLLQIYRSIIALVYSADNVNNLVEKLCSKPARFADGTLAQLLGYIIHLSAERGDVIDIKHISQMIKPEIMTTKVSSALVAYIAATDAEEFEGFSYPAKAGPEHMAVICALIPKLPVVQEAAIKQLDKELKSGKTAPMLIERVSALLEVYSEATETEGKYEWVESADDDAIKSKLLNAFNIAQKELLESAPDVSQVNVLRRAVSLFPTLDKEGVLKHIAANRKRSALTDSTVSLVEALIDSSDEAAVPEMKAWFLMVFDHLTRRFAEDAVLSEKVTALAMALGKFLARKEINLEKVIPRGTINAVIEAGIQKHISVPEVVYLAVSIASFASAKSLDLAKLLNMVLGHPENQLSFRSANQEMEDIHHYTAFLISKLFQAGKATLSNIATLDGIMESYRGTNDPIDRMLLNIILHIEGHLARSCASRIASWSVLETTEKNLISRVRGRLEVSIDAKILSKSVFHSSTTTVDATFNNLEKYMKTIKESIIPVGKSYDPLFMLPALTFCLISETHILEAQAAVERHCVSYAMVCLSSSDKSIRSMASNFLSTVAAKLEDSPYRNKTQIIHLIMALLASLSAVDAEFKDQPLPSAMGIFLAQATNVLANPTHFLYEKVMEMLLKHHLLQLHDLPLMLSILQVGEEHHKEVAWILNILTAGLKTEADLVLYRKRNVLGNVLNLYTSPNCTERAREKVLELLWNVAAIEGGGTTLITRNGVVAWIEQQLGVTKEEDLTLKRLAARLWEGSAKRHVEEWSRGNLKGHFVGAKQRLGVDV
ncbi:ribosome 60S biogenesis N-terminal-domain-containing protein [Pyronema domesticum]|nr:ribosome 60S biogenesis N-terminal-domain-containing protein [Pyronema domesticum]